MGILLCRDPGILLCRLWLVWGCRCVRRDGPERAGDLGLDKKWTLGFWGEIPEGVEFAVLRMRPEGL